jgi:hypothetical protein
MTSIFNEEDLLAELSLIPLWVQREGGKSNLKKKVTFTELHQREEFLFTILNMKNKTLVIGFDLGQDSDAEKKLMTSINSFLSTLGDVSYKKNTMDQIAETHNESVKILLTDQNDLNKPSFLILPSLARMNEDYLLKKELWEKIKENLHL